MLLVQEYLRSGKTLDDLTAEFAIKVSQHPNLPLVILNYNQIDSPKMHPIVGECRSLILENNSWNIVSRAFSRFYNFGEALEITEKFDWTNYRIYEKVDGSLTHLFYYRDAWHMATRSTFGNLLMEEQSFTWAELFWNTFGKEKVSQLNINFSYIFEMLSPYNQVVTLVKEPRLYLLEVTKHDDSPFICADIDSHNIVLAEIAKTIGVSRPKIHCSKEFNSAEKVRQYVHSLSNQDEGVVVQDTSGMRLKLKNPGWWALAQLSNNGNFYYKDLYDLVIRGDAVEVSIHYPIAEKKCRYLHFLILHVMQKTKAIYDEFRHIETQKDFALAILQKKDCMHWAMFEARKKGLTIDDIFSLADYHDRVKDYILMLIKEDVPDLSTAGDSHE